VTAGPIERNFIPPNVPLDSGSGFGVGVADTVGEGVADGDGNVAAFESCWANKDAAADKDRQNKRKVIRNWRIADDSLLNNF
jgi:hypothetical protein